MKTSKALSILSFTQLLLFVILLGCNKPDLTSPSDPNNYKNALYGKFKGMYVDYYTDIYKYTRMTISSDSYIQLDKESSTYIFKILGTASGKDISFEQNGTFYVGTIQYISAIPDKWLLGYWKGAISFSPYDGSKAWILPFEITDSGACNILYVRPRTSIFLTKEGYPYISIFSWFP